MELVFTSVGKSPEVVNIHHRMSAFQHLNVLVNANRPGAIPFTLIPSGRSSCAKDDVACPMALFENIYGYEKPPVAAS
jgi:hypothetical protein